MIFKFNFAFSVLTIFSVLLPILLAIAYMTILERKAMGEMQRRIGPNVTM
jgi:NADH:ubiquinone oxidoreductase subunit H